MSTHTYVRYLEIVLFKFLKSDFNWYFAADGVRTDCVYLLKHREDNPLYQHK